MMRVAGNYLGHKKYAHTQWKCMACPLQVREDQDHLVHCRGYVDMLAGKDMDVDSEVVEFYKLVMAQRLERGWD